MIRVLVCGGRKFTDEKLLNDVLNHLNSIHEIICIIEGGSPGADHMASRWAFNYDIPNYKFTANWLLHGKAAGPIRNKQMLRDGLPDMVVAFPGGRGTANMVRQAQEENVVVVEVLSDGAIRVIESQPPAHQTTS
jgi:hypothetical protein